MNNPFDEACAILDDFEEKIAAIKAEWKRLEEDNPHFEQVSSANWPQKYYRLWLHGATEVYECNELERWLSDYPPITKTAQSPALTVYRAWRKWLETAGSSKAFMALRYDKKTRKHVEFESKESAGSYYEADDRFDIENPPERETLFDFIVRQARSVEEEGKGDHRLQWRAWKCFLDFIRKEYPTEQVAFIEHIFPKKMSLHHDVGKIIRLIPPEAYPIPEKAAAEILIEFAHRCRNGRPDARRTAAEGMALCWLCIATSRIRLPKTLEMIRNMKPNAILSGAEFSISQVPTFGSDCATLRPMSDKDFSVLKVPTWFGDLPLKISNRVAAFLRAVSQIPSKRPRETILQRPMRSLTRVFDEVLQSVAPPSKYGNITYLSLLNQPHIFGDHRPQPKYQNSR